MKVAQRRLIAKWVIAAAFAGLVLWVVLFATGCL